MPKENSMATEAQLPARPTKTQLAYLRDLSSRTGTDFAYPGTAARARREIKRLLDIAERQDQVVERLAKLGIDEGLPAFDEVRREGTAVRFLWTDRKVMVIIDIEAKSGPDDDESATDTAIAA
jgi:hypothetical protein